MEYILDGCSKMTAMHWVLMIWGSVIIAIVSFIWAVFRSFHYQNLDDEFESSMSYVYGAILGLVLVIGYACVVYEALGGG